MSGFIHSTESFGTVDGPGIRYVVFMQGCPLRCEFCHNPDTWETGKGREVSVSEIIGEYNRNSAFYKNGGITVTGGEPLMQAGFVTELFSECKKLGIHTCLDTSGATFRPDNTAEVDKLLNVCDLVMLDIKHIDPDAHKRLTGVGNENILRFAEYLSEKNIPTWIRCVIVPGISDNPRDLAELGTFIGKLSSLSALDILPYHTLGVSKYKELGISYPLDGVSPLSGKEAKRAKEIIMSGIKASRNK